MSLRDARDYLREKIESEDVSAYTPEHDAFEVEDLSTRKNYSFVLNRNENTVAAHDTSPGAGNMRFDTVGPYRFPFEKKTAIEFYEHIYRLALKGAENRMFIGYVDPVRFQPLEG
jgi:hypothetical protein